MAVIDRARYKPDINRCTLETLVAGLEPLGRVTSAPGATPVVRDGIPAGTVSLPVQIISYSDTDVPALQSQAPGDPQIERYLTVLYEDTISVELASFTGRTAAQVQATLEQALDSWATSIKPAIPMLRRVVRAAKRTPTRAIL